MNEQEDSHPHGASDANQNDPIAARQARVLGNGPRLEPLDLSQISADLLAILGRMQTVNAVLQSNKEQRDRPSMQELRAKILNDPESAAESPEVLARLSELPEIVRTMLRHADLFAIHTDIGLHLLSKGTLTLRDRELAILRIA